MSPPLPSGFEALEPFAAVWSVATAAERDALRLNQSEAARNEFYDAAKGLLGSALDRLDQTPLNQHDAGETHLMRMMLALAHIAAAVELQRDDEPKHAAMRRHLPITQAPGDN